MKIFKNRPRRMGLTSGPLAPTLVLSETQPIMLERIMTVKRVNITLQEMQNCIINENIREPPEGTGVDIRTIGTHPSPFRNTTHSVRKNYDS
jgi:hypothetical protein